MNEQLAGGCWARLYRAVKFQATPLTLVGPLEVENLGLNVGIPNEMGVFRSVRSARIICGP